MIKVILLLLVVSYAVYLINRYGFSGAMPKITEQAQGLYTITRKTLVKFFDQLNK